MSREGWEILFMMLILKIPIVYLCAVVWYAIKAEPEPDSRPEDFSIWRPWRKPDGPRPRRGSPHGRRDTARATRSRRGRVAA
jgi:hypothetical protein